MLQPMLAFSVDDPKTTEAIKKTSKKVSFSLCRVL